MAGYLTRCAGAAVLWMLLLGQALAFSTLRPVPIAKPLGEREAQPQDVLEAQLSESTRRFVANASPAFRVALLAIDNPAMSRFAAQHILRRSEEMLKDSSHGLAAIYSASSSTSGPPQPVCYLVYRGSGAAHVLALAKALDKESGTRLGVDALVAHEMGHCLDKVEQEHVLRTEGALPIADGWRIGIHPKALAGIAGKGGLFRRVGEEAVDGASITHGQLRRMRTHLHNDPRQRRMEERFADAFSVLYLEYLGAQASLREAWARQRSRAWPGSAHATTPVFAVLPTLAEGASLGDVWQAARQAQRMAGGEPAP